MAAQPGTDTLQYRRSGGTPHRLGSGAPTGRITVPARYSATTATGRRAVIGAVAVACVPVPPRTTLQLAATEEIAQVVMVLSGSVALHGSRGPLVPVDRGVVAASRGALTLDASGPAAVVLVSLPLDVLSRRGIRLPAGTARACADGALLGPLREFTYALHRSPPASRQASRAAERGLVELLVGALLESEPPSMDNAALRGLLRSRATTIVRRRFTDPTLRPRLVAVELNVSLRHLQRAFEGSGTTVALEIRRARSEHAAMLLDTLTGPERTDRRIAARAGFTSASQLRAAFDDRFGMPTSAYRLLIPARVVQPSP
ncbi:helix-turn-helix domain-containing protein [Arthrobacter sp. B0490]|uniref:helix-turn-helix domain-containing protein n=1 Tax=Arthrobacter sp. B0490 TaxID=2058891 RepID=UPI0015E3DF51|nr:helix-turn-helix domain-containing protein [Arthrobacter sp. B0490]